MNGTITRASPDGTPYEHTHLRHHSHGGVIPPRLGPRAGSQVTQAWSARVTAFPHTQHRKTSLLARNATPAASGVERISTASTRIASGPNPTHARPFVQGRG